MPKLQYEKEIDFTRWGYRLLSLIWVYILLIICTQLAIFAFYAYTGTVDDYWAYLRQFIVLPAVCNLLAAGITTVATHYLYAKGRVGMQAYVCIGCLVVICAVLSWTHDYIQAVQGCFLVPIIIALAFIDVRLLRFSFLLSAGTYVAFVIAAHLYARTHADYRVPGIDSMMTVLALLCVTLLIAITVLRHQTELVLRLVAVRRDQHIDAFTQLYDHTGFYEKLDERIHQCNITGEDFCLLLMDIDDFMAINERYGHEVGDKVIAALAASLRGACASGDEAFRYGGEEFAILTSRDAQDSMALAEDVRLAFHAATRRLPGDFGVTVSAGVCCYSAARFESKRAFFSGAEAALQHAKRTGKNRTVLWDDSLAQNAPAVSPTGSESTV